MNDGRIETTILSNLIHNDEYARKVVPFLKPDYFSNPVERQVYEHIDAFIMKYNNMPSKESLLIEVGSQNLLEKVHKEAVEIIGSLNKSEQLTVPWLIDQTEKFCQSQALYNALIKSVDIYKGTATQGRGEIPEILREALSVSFDTQVGHEYLADVESRYEFYHTKKRKIPFDIDILNRITEGGVEDKTLNVIVAGIGVGKTFTLAHLAAAYLMLGKNVLYITLEMSQEKIAERIDANLMNVSLPDLKVMHQKAFKKRMESINARTQGRLFIKEFPSAAAHVGHFRNLLNELGLKKGFAPDVVLIDYLNICASVRSRNSSDLYQHIKAIAEEIRGLAVERKLPIWSAAQFNREGIKSTDPEMTDTAESMGLPATCDLLLALVSSKTLMDKGLILGKQLKNRYGDFNKNTRFVIGMDRAHFRLHDAPDDEQTGIIDDVSDAPVMDSTPAGKILLEDFGFPVDKDDE